MSYKDTHNLVIDAFGPSMCHNCRRTGSQLVAFKCETSASADADRQTPEPKDYNIDNLLIGFAAKSTVSGDKFIYGSDNLNAAKAQLFELITKEIIGTSEPAENNHNTNVDAIQHWRSNERRKAYRNELKAEQRQKLSDLFGKGE